MSATPSRTWVDTAQPTPLTNATMLLYLSAAFSALSALPTSLPGLLIAASQAGGAYGIANSRRWGYALAIVGTTAEAFIGVIFAYGNLTALVNFAVAAVLLYLLLHPEARTHVAAEFT